MRKNLGFPHERWCFPGPPPHPPVPDRTERWCFPDAPPRVLVTDPDEPWCFPENPPQPRTLWRTRLTQAGD
jgi:hypothetical protein